jgi:hypothetical protein
LHAGRARHARRWLRPLGERRHAILVALAAAILELAIERGVPRFNAGDQASCAALYELAITSVVLLGADALGEGASAELANALKQGANDQDASERAWTYRRAMDRALGQMAELMKSAE